MKHLLRALMAVSYDYECFVVRKRFFRGEGPFWIRAVRGLTRWYYHVQDGERWPEEVFPDWVRYHIRHCLSCGQMVCFEWDEPWDCCLRCRPEMEYTDVYTTVVDGAVIINRKP